MRVRPLRQTTRRNVPATRRAHLTSVPKPQKLTAEKRARESGGPEDRAFYTCSCGYAFKAEVSTSVSCPHCGTGQAW
jgi:hypothetical protein